MELTPDVHDSSKEIDIEKVASSRGGDSYTPGPFPVQPSAYKLMGTESDMNAII